MFLLISYENLKMYNKAVYGMGALLVLFHVVLDIVKYFTKHDIENVNIRAEDFY